ncbi:PucR family transcriptional regulator [Streptomyces sp. ISL-10]|uniref:PucR family transcriptional regulator n=1 Tax=Streptomyces sp. ISL-10 TaxID=2819172 RepID=UPI001BE7494D|nr:PucR family transcriptional regulator [Streptomyces sp. ISL-10]MBT2367093.1 PucR family transcriptional regulator [Streptomyces sp. ISL-10]
MPEPATSPPTPPIPLASLLADADLGLRQVAGPPAAEGTAVHMVHTSEMADPYPYLLGGELLLSAGVLLKDADRYVARIVEAGAAALGFGVAPVYDTVPAELVEACDRRGLPLLEVPQRTTFTAVARAVWRLMAEARHRELRRVTQAQQGLASAAARPDPVPAVLHQLAVRLEGWAVLLDADGARLYAAGREPAPDAVAGVARLARVVSPGASHRPAPASATDLVDAGHLSAYALGGGEGLVLGLAAPAREAGDHTVAGVAVVLLSLLTAPQQGTDAGSRSAALVRLLLGASPTATAPLLGPGPWTVIHARGGDGTPFAATALGATLGSALVDPDADGSVRILLPTAREVTAQPGWTLGVSAPSDPAALPAADTQAARAVRHAVATRRDLVRHRETAPLSPDEARLRLAPLTDSPALVETLRTWLSLHGSWDRTAAAMEIHRNTVRQRIERAARLLEEDLDDVDVRMELWFALRHG